MTLSSDPPEPSRSPTDTPPGWEDFSVDGQPTLDLRQKGGGCLSPLTALALGGGVLLLAAILVPNFVRAKARGQLTACKSNLKNVSSALEMYATDYDGKYPTTLAALTPNYLKTLPECPSAGKANYRLQVGLQAPMNVERNFEEGPKGPWPDYYYIDCAGENHRSTSVTGDYPAFNAVDGLIERAP